MVINRSTITCSTEWDDEIAWKLEGPSFPRSPGQSSTGVKKHTTMTQSSSPCTGISVQTPHTSVDFKNKLSNHFSAKTANSCDKWLIDKPLRGDGSRVDRELQNTIKRNKLSSHFPREEDSDKSTTDSWGGRLTGAHCLDLEVDHADPSTRWARQAGAGQRTAHVPRSIPRGLHCDTPVEQNNGNIPEVCTTADSVPQLSTTSSNIPHVCTSTGNISKVCISAGSIPSVSTSHGNSPHVSTYNGNSPHVSTSHGNSPHVSTSHGNSPHVSTPVGYIPHRSTAIGNIPQVSLSTSRIPHVQTSAGRIPHVQTSAGSIPHVKTIPVGLPPQLIQSYFNYLSQLTNPKSSVPGASDITTMSSGDTVDVSGTCENNGRVSALNITTGQEQKCSEDQNALLNPSLLNPVLIPLLLQPPVNCGQVNSVTGSGVGTVPYSASAGTRETVCPPVFAYSLHQTEQIKSKLSTEGQAQSTSVEGPDAGGAGGTIHGIPDEVSDSSSMGDGPHVTGQNANPKKIKSTKVWQSSKHKVCVDNLNLFYLKFYLLSFHQIQ